MWRWLLLLGTAFTAGCGTDSMPQLFNEAAQTKAEFVDKLMRIVDEDTAGIHFELGKKQYEERLEEVKKRFDKLKDNLGFDSFERKMQKLLQPGPDGKPPAASKPGALVKGLENDWLGQLLTMREAMEAKRAYMKQEYYTELRLAREVARLRSLQSALGPNASKVGAAVSFLGGGKSQDASAPKFEFLKGVTPQELFLNGDFFVITFEEVALPPPPQYAPGGGPAGKKDDPLPKPKEKK